MSVTSGRQMPSQDIRRLWVMASPLLPAVSAVVSANRCALRNYRLPTFFPRWYRNLNKIKGSSSDGPFSYCPHLNISYHTIAKLFIEKISLYIRERFAVCHKCHTLRTIQCRGWRLPTSHPNQSVEDTLILNFSLFTIHLSFEGAYPAFPHSLSCKLLTLMV